MPVLVFGNILTKEGIRISHLIQLSTRKVKTCAIKRKIQGHQTENLGHRHKKKVSFKSQTMLKSTTAIDLSVIKVSKKMV